MIRSPLSTAVFVYDGGCANYADIQYSEAGTGHTVDSCNQECHKLNWCTHIILRNSDD